MNEKNKELLKEEYLKELNALTKDKIKITGDTPLDLMKYNAAKTKLFAENSRKAADMVENYMKSWYKYGEELSKAYMTMLTVNDIYGEAKEAGASDFDSAVITSGYAAMEYALLSTDIGKWILPELRAHRLENKAIRNALTKPMIDNFKKLAANAKNSEAAKRTYL